LSIYSNAELKALKSVGGDLYIYSNAELKADKLESVGGYLSIYSNAELKADKLESVGGCLSIYSNAELKALKSVGGCLSIYSNAELKALKSVGGYLSINSKIGIAMENRLWSSCKNNKWKVSNVLSEKMLNRLKTKKDTEYNLNNVRLEREWFDKIRKDELTPDEVFAIDNIEHRRIAYEYMDKFKMKSLKDYKVLDKKKDEKGNVMRIVSFTVQNMREPLKFYNCFCPSTGREYYIGTDKDKTKEAKLSSFGLNEGEFINEW
jgi:hypothetical protein